MTSADRGLSRVITFAPMIDSELARLVLAHHGVAFDERDHLFGWVSLLTLFHGGYGQAPMLYGKGLRLSGPRAMAEHFDKLVSADEKLIPISQPEALRFETDWAAFNTGLGSDVAVLCYFHMLPEREAMIELFARGLPRAERAVLPAFYPALRSLFSLLLRLSPVRMDDVTTRIHLAFDAVARRGDAHPYLGGDRITLSDLSFAASAAPLVLPDGYVAPVPSLEQMPPELRAIASELRRHPAAKRVAAVYAPHAKAVD